jgi:hypothetical protein
MLFRQPQDRFSGGPFADDLEVGPLQETFQTCADNLMVVDNQDSDAHAALQGFAN